MWPTFWILHISHNRLCTVWSMNFGKFSSVSLRLWGSLLQQLVQLHIVNILLPATSELSFNWIWSLWDFPNHSFVYDAPITYFLYVSQIDFISTAAVLPTFIKNYIQIMCSTEIHYSCKSKLTNAIRMDVNVIKISISKLMHCPNISYKTYYISEMF